MERPTTVAVTGAAGFLGGHVCRALTERGHRVIAMVRNGSDRKPPAALRESIQVRAGDVLDGASLEAALRGADAVVHCAGLVSIDHANGERVKAVNVAGTQHVLQACSKLGIRLLVHISSVHAFAELQGKRLNRDSRLATAASLPYCAAKASAHQIMLNAMTQGQIGGCIICPAGIIGPGDSRPSPVGQMILDIARKKLPLLVNEGYWWCDVRDIAEAVAEAVTPPSDGGVYFTPGRYAKFVHLARLCSEALEYDVTRPAVPYWLAVAALPAVSTYAAARRLSPLYTRASLNLARNCPASVDDESAKSVLGYVARPLDESIWDALGWFRTNGALT